MKKFLKTSVLAILVLALTVMTAVGAAADTSLPEGGYDAATEGIVSSYYYVDEEQGFISGIAPGTTAEQLQKVCVPGNTQVSQQTLATGTTICAALSEETSCQLTVIVTGDLNGDGAVTITDMLMLKSALLGETLSNTAEAAGDINYDGSVTITDFLRVKAELLGMGSIPAGGPADGEALILMTPGATESWAVAGAVSFVSADEAVAAIDGEGTVTAGAGEGTAFIYALDENGQVMARTLVTVLNEGLRVSFVEDSCRLQQGQSLALRPVLNHPVSASITWTTSDSTVVTVSESGTLEAHSFGTAVVTATLRNGSSAEMNVTVAPPITAIKFEKSLHKVKPNATKNLRVLMTPADTGEQILWTTSDAAIATVSDDGTVTGVTYGTVTITATGKYSGLTASCKVKVCNVKQVAMTFDDGPSPHTAKLLDFLKENEIKVTFFVVGNRLNSFQNTMRREVAEGHEIGYHSYAHQIQTGLTDAQIRSDFAKSNDILKNLTGASFTLWRTPGGGFSNRVLQCVKLPHIMWSVDTYDWKTLNTTKVYKAILQDAKDGSIILLHDLHRTSVEGAILAMQEMIKGDYEFVTVTELLSRDGIPPVNSKNYYSGFSN